MLPVTAVVLRRRNEYVFQNLPVYDILEVVDYALPTAEARGNQSFINDFYEKYVNPHYEPMTSVQAFFFTRQPDSPLTLTLPEIAEKLGALQDGLNALLFRSSLKALDDKSVEALLQEATDIEAERDYRSDDAWEKRR